MRGHVDAGAREAVLPLRVLDGAGNRVARVLATEGGPLAGMALLRGSRLTVNATPGGAIRVEELPG